MIQEIIPRGANFQHPETKEISTLYFDALTPCSFILEVFTLALLLKPYYCYSYKKYY